MAWVVLLLLLLLLEWLLELLLLLLPVPWHLLPSPFPCRTQARP